MTRDNWFTVGDILRARNTFSNAWKNEIVHPLVFAYFFAHLAFSKGTLIPIFQPNGFTNVGIEA